MPISRRSVLIGLGAFAITTPSAFARLQLEGTLGVGFKPMRIAVLDFTGGPAGAQIAGIVAADLKRSGLFEPIAREQFPQASIGFSTPPDFQAWSAAGVQALIVGQLVGGGAQITTQYRLWDVAAGQQADAQEITAGGQAQRRAAHIVADAVYSQIVGEKGFFDTRVVFVDESGSKENRKKRLAVMDSDGANVRPLTRGNDLVVTPRFSPNAQDVVYMSFQGDRNPRVFLLDLGSGKRQSIGEFPGMTFSPRFSPDGGSVVDEHADGKRCQHLPPRAQLRRNAAADRWLRHRHLPFLFAGRLQHCFRERPRRAAADLCHVGRWRRREAHLLWRRLLFDPRLVAEGRSHRLHAAGGRKFEIGVMRPDGSGEKTLVSGFHNEGPTWAPNGRYLMYFSERGGGPKIYMTDIFGRVNVQIPTPNFASDPSWSNLLSEAG